MAEMSGSLYLIRQTFVRRRLRSISSSVKIAVLAAAVSVSGVFAHAQSGASAPQATPAATSSPDTVKANPTKPTKSGLVLPPEKSQPVKIARFEKAPVIDGKLDDDVWKTAANFKDFLQTNPGDNIEPSKPTEVMIGYDAKTLYIGFHCF